MCVIYKITCTANNKFYIGSTVNKRQRWASHRRDLRAGTHKNKSMQASWSKYGEALFVFEVVELVEKPEFLFVVEQRYLDEVVGQDNCFNWSKYAGAPMRGMYGVLHPNFGKPMSDAAKQLLRERNTGSRNASWGVPVPEERKQKIRDSNKAYPHKERKHTPEAIAKIAAASRGRPVSEETRAKRSAALKGREISTIQRLQISRTLSGEGNFWFGKQRPDSFKEKIRKAVSVTDAGGVTTVYNSIQALREATGLNPPTVNRALKSGEALRRGPFKGWTFKYVVDPAPK